MVTFIEQLLSRRPRGGGGGAGRGGGGIVGDFGWKGKSFVLLRKRVPSSSSTENQDRSGRNIVVEKKPPPPLYKTVESFMCPLFLACSVRNWEIVESRTRERPDETFHFFATTLLAGTALHFCSMPGADCPLSTIAILLNMNPHAVTVKAAYYEPYEYGATPLHFLCDIRNGMHWNNAYALQLYVNAAIKADQMYENPHPTGGMRVAIDWSPLYLAASNAARPDCLQVLCDSKRLHGLQWIAPYTGAESFQQILHRYETIQHDIESNPHLTADQRARRLRELKLPEKSPLAALWMTCKFSDPDYSIHIHTKVRMRELTNMMLDFPDMVPNIATEDFFTDNDTNSQYSETSKRSRAGRDRKYCSADNRDYSDEDRFIVLQSWIQCMVLLRDSILQHKKRSLVHVAACLYCPIPGLFHLATELFPDHLMPAQAFGNQRNNNLNINKSSLSRQGAWSLSSYHKKRKQHQQQQHELLGRRLDDELLAPKVNAPFHDLLLSICDPQQTTTVRQSHELVRILTKHQPEALSVPGMIANGDWNQPPELYYPCFLAALQNAKTDTIFHLLQQCPQALELQRQLIQEEDRENPPRIEW